MTEQQPEAPAVPGVTRWQVRGPLFVDAIRWTGENEADIAAFVGDAGTFEVKVGGFAVVWNRATGECVNLAIGYWIVLGVTGIFFGRSADDFAATYEPAPEHGSAVTVISDALDLTEARTDGHAETIAAAREALRVLSGEETDARPGGAIVETLEAPPVAAACWCGRDEDVCEENGGCRWSAAMSTAEARTAAAELKLTLLRTVLLEGGQDAATVRRRALAIIGTEGKARHG
jgi:hypothetical protein